MGILSKEEREARARKLADRQRNDWANKDKGGGSFPSIFRKDRPFQEWYCKSEDSKKHKIDILDYDVGERNTHGLPAGEPDYWGDYWCHKDVGAKKVRVVCMQRTFGEPCAICEDRKALADKVGYEDARVKTMKAIRYTVYNVIVYDTPEDERKGVQIWIVPYKFFQQFLIDMLPEGGGVASFAGEFGKRIEFYKRGKTEVSFSGHNLVERPRPIPEELLQKSYCLEDLVHIPTYEEVRDLHYNKVVADPGDNDDEREPEPERRPEPERQPEPELVQEWKGSGGEPKCPFGGTLGVDMDKFDCSNCPRSSFEACLGERQRMKRESQGSGETGAGQGGGMRRVKH